MKIFIDAIMVSFEMMGIFLGGFVAIFLLALLLNPIENKLSKLVWKHSDVEVQKAVRKSSFNEFSHKHR